MRKIMKLVGSGLRKIQGLTLLLYTGFQQCLLDPTKNNPDDFFKALFTSHMYTIMAEEMNKYTQRKIQRGKYFQ